MSPYHHHPPRPGKKAVFVVIYETRYCDAVVGKVFGSGPHCVITNVVKIERMSKTGAIHYHAKVVQSKIYQKNLMEVKFLVLYILGRL